MYCIGRYSSSSDETEVAAGTSTLNRLSNNWETTPTEVVRGPDALSSEVSGATSFLVSLELEPVSELVVLGVDLLFVLGFFGAGLGRSLGVRRLGMTCRL